MGVRCKLLNRLAFDWLIGQSINHRLQVTPMTRLPDEPIPVTLVILSNPRPKFNLRCEESTSLRR